MTLHTKAATDDIYDIFNAPLKQCTEMDAESADEDDYETDEEYTTDAESTGTTKQIDTSEHGDDEISDIKSVSEWSDFSTRKHVPVVDGEGANTERNETLISDFIKGNMPEGPIQEISFQDVVEDGSDTVDFPPRTRTIFVPLPPEDYEPPTRPYRDPAEVANNRLPFMTPITERTEASLDVNTEYSEQFKTPSKHESSLLYLEGEDEHSALEPLSSPLQEILQEEHPKLEIREPLAPKVPEALSKASSARPPISKGPAIKELQCSPVDETIRQEIVATLQPPLTSYSDLYDYREQKYERSSDIRKYAKALGKIGKNNTDKTIPQPTPLILEFPSGSSKYSIKRELGAGAFAPVYLVENSVPREVVDVENSDMVMGQGAFAIHHRDSIEAMKMESPPNPWEFYVMRLAHSRLGPQHRATMSISYAHELRLYRDEAFLFLPYHPYGTLLDVVNFFRAEPSGIMDEQLAMFFAIELMRTVEGLHAKSVIHGDLKADNCLLRLDSGEQVLSSHWFANGGGGWSTRGVVLIDFGRGIDMRAFLPEVEFIADWKTSAQDCPEMREGRPWTWQIDYYGLAGTIHCLLFGKYIETVRCDQGGLGRTGRKYKIRESLKRYWQTELWSDCFEVLLNPTSFAINEDCGKMPVLKSMRGIRERMEIWLEANCERGVGLKSSMGKLEAFARNRK